MNRRLLPLLVASVALAVAGTAQAQDGGAKPAPQPAPTPAPKPAPAPAAAAPQAAPADAPPDKGHTYIHEKLVLRSVDPKTKAVLESHMFRVGHKRGDELKKMLTELSNLHKVPGLQFNAYETDHLLIVSGPPESVRWARQLLEGLDRPDDMIRIEALIIEVEVGEGLETGLESSWDRKTSDRTFFRGYDMEFNPDSFLRATSSRPFQGATGNFNTAGSPSTQARVGDLDLAIRAIQTRNQVNLLSRPRGLVKNGEKLTLSSGVKILVPQRVSFDALNNPQTTLQQQEVVTKIEGTPHIVGPHTVELDLTVLVQDLLRETPPEEIKTSHREIRTKVVLNEGENFLALGGLLRKRTQVQENGIPLLADIPLLGYLFKSFSKSITTFELHVYVRVFIERVEAPESSERLIIPDDLRRR